MVKIEKKIIILRSSMKKTTCKNLLSLLIFSKPYVKMISTRKALLHRKSLCRKSATLFLESREWLKRETNTATRKRKRKKLSSSFMNNKVNSSEDLGVRFLSCTFIYTPHPHVPSDLVESWMESVFVKASNILVPFMIAFADNGYVFPSYSILQPLVPLSFMTFKCRDKSHALIKLLA